MLLPEEDAQARFRPGHVSVTDEMPQLLGPDLVPAILDAGYNFDFIDSAAIDRVGIRYPVLILPQCGAAAAGDLPAASRSTRAKAES